MGIGFFLDTSVVMCGTKGRDMYIPGFPQRTQEMYNYYTTYMYMFIIMCIHVVCIHVHVHVTFILLGTPGCLQSGP